MKPARIVFIGADYPDLEKHCPHHLGVQIGLKRLGIPYKFISCRPTLDVNSVIEFKPDLVIYGLKDLVIHHEWRKEIRENLPNAKIVMYYGDYRDSSTGQFQADCSEMDAMFISNDAQEEYYKQKWKFKQVHFLPLGCEPIKAPKKSKLYDLPFIFIGGLIHDGVFNRRAEQIEKFKVEDGLKVISSFEPNMRGRIFREMPSIYSSAGTCLDISHFTDVKRYTSIRFWEIPAFWGFALTKRFPGCEEFYPEDTRAYFDDYGEAIEKKMYYERHPKERRIMLAKAHKISYQHTYDKRFTKMFSLL